MSDDAKRFAETVLTAFQARGLVTDREVGTAGGPSTSTMTAIRGATRGAGLAKPRGDTMRRIEVAANWMPGSGRRVWDGGEPVSATPPLSTSLTALDLLNALTPVLAKVWDEGWEARNAQTRRTMNPYEADR